MEGDALYERGRAINTVNPIDWSGISNSRRREDLVYLKEQEGKKVMRTMKHICHYPRDISNLLIDGRAQGCLWKRVLHRP